ncbi:hypothetical protein PV08_11624 [Exophiala spinifera]|uniref:Phosphatidylinositol-specific phospholipase C X domain-containing protein n=1 Tax=Exophiala spinifera TaxID=91928 RepID=A0A0D2AW17_9EURO|nr:uncharacterized protein PV08_11624 [Exophiala spinifera]KIW10660.1 hypothetical protein PV08_11624 [Exophiala spinifera]
MWEKPIHCYVFVNGPQYEVSISLTNKNKPFGKDVIVYKMADQAGTWQAGLFVATPTFQRTTKGPWANNRMVLDSSNISGLFETVGKLQLVVKVNGTECCFEWQEVDSLWGGLGSGTMKDVGFQKTTIFENHMVQFTLYDAGPGLAGLPRSHQLNVTVAPKRSNWMGDVAPSGSPQEQKSFRKFVLPCAHDCGIFSMETVQKLAGLSMDKWSMIQEAVFPLTPQYLQPFRALSPGLILKVVEALSRTQKDDIKTQLALGARYFEFRASKIPSCPPWLSDEYYFHHNMIPGVPLKTFFHDVVEFLGENEQEIVVIRLEFNHYSKSHPDKDFVRRLLDSELQASIANGNQLKTISFPPEERTIAELRSNDERLIFFFNDEPDAQPYDNYSSDRHADLKGDRIIAEFETYDIEEQTRATNPTQFTIFQCQGTASENNDVVANTVITGGNKCLLATKAICDAKTLPWLTTKALDRLADDHLGVIMNDFFDLATSDVANLLSTLRLLDQDSHFNFFPYEGEPKPKLTIEAAYWADLNVKPNMTRSISGDGTMLTVDTGNLNITDPWPLTKKTLCILYSYSSSTDVSLLITTENNGSTNITPTVGPGSANATGFYLVDTFDKRPGQKLYIVAVVYGFKLVESDTVHDRIQKTVEDGQPIIVTDEFFESDGFLSYTKTCYIFYRTTIEGPIKAAVAKQYTALTISL